MPPLPRLALRCCVAPMIAWVTAAGCGAGGGSQAPDPADPTPDAGVEAGSPPEASIDATDELEDTDVGDGEASIEAGPGRLEQLTYVGAEGTRDYLLYIPAGYDGSTARPLMVAMHGCAQTASEFSYSTRLNDVADREGFLVAYPQQSLSANSMGCWNWFLPAHQQRDIGEAAVIAGIVAEVSSHQKVDPARVHAVGISAGGAMAIVAGVVFADVFASVASVAGCPFGGTPCVGAPSTLSPEALADLAWTAMSDHGRMMPILVIQGTFDTSVLPINAELIVGQFLGIADHADDGSSNGTISRQPGHTDNGSAGYSYSVDAYVQPSGAVIVERWLVEGLGHAWPGGAPAFAYSDPKGPAATEETYRFFLEHPRP